MKNNLICILLWFVQGMAVVHAQERSVEGFIKERDESITRVKLLENEQNKIVLVIADSSSTVDLDSIIRTNNYSDFTLHDSIKKLNDTIQQVLILQNGELKMIDTEIGLKVKKYTESFSIKIEASESTNDIESISNTRTLEISYKYWCMGSNTYWDTKPQCESTCTGECYKRTF